MAGKRRAGDVRARDITAHEVITGIKQSFLVIYQAPFEPSPDLEELRDAFLSYLCDCYTHLDIKGIVQVQRVAPSIPLAAVYVPLKATTQGPTGPLRVAGRMWAGLPAEETEAAMALLERSAQPKPVEVALKNEPAVVVLGDPGSGKSTLLKVIALALAQDRDGPLPMLLPLNAYADHLLKHGEVSLTAYLGEYYAARQKRLAGVGALFESALTSGRAVVLLDGLDEVQAERPFLVRLVQDFVRECVAMPADADTVVPGNRVVVTSRLVGYDDAPLTGERWRTYSLQDFDRDDIERFVGQWTLAFEMGVREGDSPKAREAAETERAALLDAIDARESVARLAANPLLLTILALIKRTGVSLPGHRAKLYELYLEALIESWNLARSLDQRPVGPQLGLPGDGAGAGAPGVVAAGGEPGSGPDRRGPA